MVILVLLHNLTSRNSFFNIWFDGKKVPSILAYYLLYLISRNFCKKFLISSVCGQAAISFDRKKCTFNFGITTLFDFTEFLNTFWKQLKQFGIFDLPTSSHKKTRRCDNYRNRDEKLSYFHTVRDHRHYRFFFYVKPFTTYSVEIDSCNEYLTYMHILLLNKCKLLSRNIFKVCIFCKTFILVMSHIVVWQNCF